MTDWPPGLGFAAVVKDENFLDTVGERFGLPVVSVGNLTLGGTNKTPFVEMLVQEVAARGIRVGIVSRGYKGGATAPEIVGRSAPGSFAGDEPMLLHHRLPDVPIAVANDRNEGITLLGAEENVELAVADDAFQHRRLRRDVDIVLVDALVWKREANFARLLRRCRGSPPGTPRRDHESRPGLLRPVGVPGKGDRKPRRAGPSLPLAPCREPMGQVGRNLGARGSRHHVGKIGRCLFRDREPRKLQEVPRAAGGQGRCGILLQGSSPLHGKGPREALREGAFPRLRHARLLRKGHLHCRRVGAPMLYSSRE